MIINYGVWKYIRDNKGKPIYRNGKKKIDAKNGHIELDIDWDNNTDHKRIREEITKKHPGYHIYGYCPKPDKTLDDTD